MHMAACSIIIILYNDTRFAILPGNNDTDNYTLVMRMCRGDIFELDS